MKENALIPVLLADDDPGMRLILRKKIQATEGFCVIAEAATGDEAMALFEKCAPRVVFLDVDMPGMDGVTVCRRIREVSGVPIIFLSAYARTDDRIRGLMAGGDDYLGKPYSLTELELRIRLRIQRRHNKEMRDVLRFGELEIDLGLREVRCQEDSASLTALEFDLLAFLAQNPGQVFSYEQLYDRVWKAPVNKGIHNMQVCMARVRQKLEQLCPSAHYIETVRGKGYRFRREQQQ